MRAFGIVFLLLAACGGATTTDLFADGGPSDGSVGGGDAGKSDARSDGGGANCNDLLAKVDDLRKKAIVCNPQSGSTQCDKQVDDLCCPLTVTGGDRKDVVDFIAAVKAAKAAGCAVACPATPCSGQATNKCDSNGSCRQLP